MKKRLVLIFLALSLFLASGCSYFIIDQEEFGQDPIVYEDLDPEVSQLEDDIDIDGEYTSKEDLALYIYKYKNLPSNFISKKEARDLGWDSKEGNLWDVAPGKSIGGDYFANREGLLPEKDSRKYYECDVNYQGGYRSGERLVYSNDGLIYYTGDHYNSFELLYGDD